MRATDVDRAFGERLRWTRKASGLSQTTIAQRSTELGAKLSRVALMEIEQGRRPATVGEATALAEALGTTVAALVGDEPVNLLMAAQLPALDNARNGA